MKLTFNLEDKLKQNKQIDFVFKEGRALKVYPLKLVFLPVVNQNSKLKIAVAVPKKGIKKAVHRNRIKRLIRESYRLNKPLVELKLKRGYMAVFLYLGKDLPAFETVNIAVKNLIHQLIAIDETL